MGVEDTFRGKPILADEHGRVYCYDIVSKFQPDVSPGQEGKLWIDIGVDGSVSEPRLKVWLGSEYGWVLVAAQSV